MAIECRDIHEEILRRCAMAQQNIRQACMDAGRDPDAVTLMAVTKTVPAEQVNIAVSAGIDVLGENRVQEFLSKKDDYDPRADVQFIGHLQTNKVRQIVGSVSLIHSVDSLKLAAAIQKEAAARQIMQPVLLEVNIAEEEAKSGFAPADVFAAAEAALSRPHVRVRGLMTIPPFDADRDTNIQYFGKVRALYVDINAKLFHNELECLSMGMSGDYADAIRAGATMVRVGTAIFGARHYT